MIFINNKYTRCYYSIISTAQSRVLPNEMYSERHHIIPKSLGGNNLKDNLVKLTAREHFICHLLLTKMTEGENKAKMAKAVFMFATLSSNQDRYKINSHWYKSLKIKSSNARRNVPSPLKGLKITDADRLQQIQQSAKERELKYQTGELSRGNMGKYNRTEEYIEYLRVDVKNRKGFSTKGQSAETRKRAAKNISIARKGQPAHNKGIAPSRVSCLCCKKEVDIRNFSRYHRECKNTAFSKYIRARLQYLEGSGKTYTTVTNNGS